MTQPHRLAAGIIIVSGLITAHVLAMVQTSTRTILYDRNVPIAQRLLPGDTNVVVTKIVIPPAIGTRTSSFEQEVQRLSLYDKIVLLELSLLQGELVDNGTWVRTRLGGQPIQFLKGSGNAFEFWNDGGSTTIGAVVVSAGVYPQFAVGQQYLVFFNTDSATGTLHPGLAFHIDSQGKLETLRLSDGSPIAGDSNLIGRSTSEIVAAFSQVK